MSRPKAKGDAQLLAHPIRVLRLPIARLSNRRDVVHIPYTLPTESGHNQDLHWITTGNGRRFVPDARGKATQ